MDDAGEIRRDIDRAAQKLQRSELLGRVGRLITLISLPIAAYDAMHGTAVGLGLTPVGAAVERLSAFNANKASWMQFGVL
jgi:hypothetical protein